MPPLLKKTVKVLFFDQFIFYYLIISFVYFFTVCVKLVRRFTDTLEGDEKNDASLIEIRFKQFCKNLKGKDERFV